MTSSCPWCAFPVVVRGGNHAAWCPRINPQSRLTADAVAHDDVVRRAIDLRQSGLTYEAIGREINRSRRTVWAWCKPLPTRRAS